MKRGDDEVLHVKVRGGSEEWVARRRIAKRSPSDVSDLPIMRFIPGAPFHSITGNE